MELGWLVFTVTITVLAVLVLSLMIIRITRGAADAIQAKKDEQRRDDQPSPSEVRLAKRQPARRGEDYVVDIHQNNNTSSRSWFHACAEDGFPHVLVSLETDASAMIFETTTELKVDNCVGPIDSTIWGDNIYIGIVGFNDVDNSVKLTILSMDDNAELIEFTTHAVHSVAFTGRQDVVLCDNRVLLRDDGTLHVFRILPDQRSLVRIQTMNDCLVDNVLSFEGTSEYAAIIGQHDWIQFRWNGEKYDAARRMSHEHGDIMRGAIQQDGTLVYVRKGHPDTVSNGFKTAAPVIHLNAVSDDSIICVDAEGSVYVNDRLIYKVNDSIEYVLSSESGVVFTMCHNGAQLHAIHR